jgi:small GTP-binding protein
MYDVYKTYSETKPSKQKITGKAILLGESGVGKTCIIKRLIDNIFNIITPTTFGSSSTEKKYVFNNTELKLEIWDTAGQEIYRSLNHIFYRDANIVLLVYDITNRRSFEEMKTYWFRQIEKSCEIEDPSM